MVKLSVHEAMILCSSYREMLWSRDLNLAVAMVQDTKYSWSRGYDLGNSVISWLWSGQSRDPTFSDHKISWSREYDLEISMIFLFWDFWKWFLNCEIHYRLMAFFGINWNFFLQQTDFVVKSAKKIPQGVQLSYMYFGFLGQPKIQ